ncbi:MAG: hypothetical protein GY915_03035, partial [bacterium]|nr:hypothetical protein [bacterium]
MKFLKSLVSVLLIFFSHSVKASEYGIEEVKEYISQFEEVHLVFGVSPEEDDWKERFPENYVFFDWAENKARSPRFITMGFSDFRGFASLRNNLSGAFSNVVFDDSFFKVTGNWANPQLITIHMLLKNDGSFIFRPSIDNVSVDAVRLNISKEKYLEEMESFSKRVFVNSLKIPASLQRDFSTLI